jgi:hypothetical protein
MGTDLPRVQIQGMVEGRDRLVEMPVQGEDIAQHLVQPVARRIERQALQQPRQLDIAPRRALQPARRAYRVETAVQAEP